MAEVESRGIHRTKACSSLYTYCIYELRFSEDAASRRVCAARLVKRFPALLEAVANGELHLTGLLMLGPYFTTQNQLELRARAQFRTKKELAKLVRSLDPLPDVPARIIPLGPAPASAGNANARPDWNTFSHSLCAPVRELAVGDRPKDWASAPFADDDPARGPLETELTSRSTAPARDGMLGSEGSPAPARDGVLSSKESAAPARDGAPGGERPVAASERGEILGVLTAPQRYQVQFTASEEHVQLIERAQALLSRGARNGGALAEIYLLALRALVTELEKQKYGTVRAGQRTEFMAAEPEPEIADAPTFSEASRPRVRHVPAVERRSVFDRDGARCSYVDARGQRCRETRCPELHHLVPFALDGVDSSENLAIFCGLCRMRHNPHYAALGFMPHRRGRTRGSLDYWGHRATGVRAYAA